MYDRKKFVNFFYSLVESEIKYNLSNILYSPVKEMRHKIQFVELLYSH